MDAFAARLLILSVLGLLAIVNTKPLSSRFTNLKCESFDLNFTKVKNCRLKLLGRNVVAASVHLNMLQLPIDDVMVNWSMWRRYNGYQPFLYNTTFDFCTLLKQSKRLSFERLVFEAFASKSNLNHSCPITGDVIIDNLVFTDKFLQSLPLPQGDYMIKLRFGSHKVWKFEIDVCILRAE